MFKDTPEMEQLKNELRESLRRETHLRSLCIAMRLAQVDYFATKGQQALVRSKGAESRLDKELFGAPLKFKTLTRGENGELTYDGDNRKADGAVPGASKAESTDARHTVSILGRRASAADNR